MKNLTNLACVLAAASILPAQATLITYVDRAAFNAGVPSQTLIDFEGLAPVGLFTYFPTPPGLTLSGVNFNIDPTTSNGILFVVDSAYASYAPTAVLSSQGSSLADDNILVTLPGGINSIGVDVGGFGFDLVTIGLSSGETTSVTSGGDLPQNGFVGFTASSPIAWLKISQAPGTSGGSGVLNIDDFAFGVRPVPDSSSAVVELSCLAFLGYYGGRRLRRTPRREG